MGHIIRGRLYMAQGSVNSFHLLDTVAGFPRPNLTDIGTCVEGREETRAELYIHHSDSTDPQAVPDVLQLV